MISYLWKIEASGGSQARKRKARRGKYARGVLDYINTGDIAMNKKKIGVISMVLYVIAALCVLYFIIVVTYAGLGSKFHLIWPVFAGILILLGYLFSLHHRYVIRIPNPVLIAIGVCFLVGGIALGTAEVQIIKNGHEKPSSGAKYILVLGTRVNGVHITLPLRYRLEAALDYALDNPSAQIIVTGGKGSGENIPEALAMQSWLTSQGIPDSRILVEDKAANTIENIQYSMALMENPASDKTVIVTNAFHIYRSLEICRTQGMENIQGLGAKSNRLMIPSFYLREGLAVLKYKMLNHTIASG